VVIKNCRLKKELDLQANNLTAKQEEKGEYEFTEALYGEEPDNRSMHSCLIY